MGSPQSYPKSTKFLIPDPVALKFLEEGEDVRLISLRQELSGFEVYIVEQWACSRLDQTIAIATFTGNTQHKIQVAVIEIFSEPYEESTQVRTYLKSSDQRHARRHDTPFGQILITNLSTFPSTLTILAIPEGDIFEHKAKFLVNENLKRTGCSGRAGISLTGPAEAVTSRFRALYKISERVKGEEAVAELVQMCQIALSMFAKLKPSICDGLLCDPTQKGLSEWWVDIGSQYYSIEPSDGILGPTTVSALLGLFLGARNRLHAYGAPVSKDVFDITTLKRGIAYFQKSQRLAKTRRFDHNTLQRLHRVTTKIARHEGWVVPRAVKSTVAEFGKGGEMVMGMVGAREKVSPADVETTDYDHFLKHISGDQCKWLWYGKKRKAVLSKTTVKTAEALQSLTGKSLSQAILSSGSDKDEEACVDKYKQSQETSDPSNSRSFTTLVPDDKGEMPADKLSSVKVWRASEGRRGLERIRDAVNTGLKMSAPKSIVGPAAKPDKNSQNEIHTKRSLRSPLTSDPVDKPPQTKKGNLTRRGQDRVLTWSSFKDMAWTRDFTSRPIPRSRARSFEMLKSRRELGPTTYWSEHAMSMPDCAMSLAHYGETKLGKTKPKNVSRKDTNIDADKIGNNMANTSGYYASDVKQPTAFISGTEGKYGTAMEHKSIYIENIIQNLKACSKSLHIETDERRKTIEEDVKSFDELELEGCAALKERLREIEALGARLEYELGVLGSKIEEVEDGITDLDRQVSDLESRGRSLDTDSQHHTWQHWVETIIRRIGVV